MLTERRNARRTAMLNSDDALEVAEAEVERLFDEHEFSQIAQHEVYVGVARWDGRNGVCKYNKQLDGERRFGKKMPRIPAGVGTHVIVINEKILEQGNRDGFLDTVRHELAHAIAYEIHGESQKHNHNWKALAAKLGAEPTACHNRRDRSDEYDYYLYCTNCGQEWGRTKRSKTIKQPFNYGCSSCNHSGLSSYDGNGERPDESGVVAIDSLDWSNRDEWVAAGRP